VTLCILIFYKKPSAATGVNVKALGDLLDSFIQPDEKNSAKKKKKIWCC